MSTAEFDLSWLEKEFGKFVRMMLRDLTPVHVFDVDGRRDGKLMHWSFIIVLVPKENALNVVQLITGQAQMTRAEPLEENVCHIRSAWPVHRARDSLCGITPKIGYWGGLATADCRDCLALALRAGRLNELDPVARDFVLDRLGQLGVIRVAG